MEVVAVPRVVGDDEETKVPMRLRSAIFKILELHNIKNTIKPEDIEGMEKSGALNELKANDENNMTEIIELIHKVYNTDEYLKKKGTRISEHKVSIQNFEESIRLQKALLS